tara:strand:+ start:828 stop:989 length:162 start_codon:yes stop_codon:yes gene_type:complete
MKREKTRTREEEEEGREEGRNEGIKNEKKKEGISSFRFLLLLDVVLCINNSYY